MKTFTKNWKLFLLLLVPLVAFAAGERIFNDQLIIGNPGSSNDKKVEFDSGDGAGNRSIISPDSGQRFNFVNVDELKFGDGSDSGDKRLIADVNGANDPEIRFNTTSGAWQFSTDGSVFQDVGAGGGITKNYIENGDALANTDGWSVYADSQSVNIDVSDNQIDLANHYLNTQDVVVFSGITNVTGITNGTTYYVVSPVEGAFSVSATLGGSAISLGGTDDTGVTMVTSRIVDGGGGSPTVTFTRNTSTPLDGDADFAFAKTGVNSLGQGACYEFADLARTDRQSSNMYLFANYDASAANYNDGDLRYYVISSSDNFSSDFNVITPSPRDIRAGQGRIIANVPTDSTDTDYRVCFHVATPETNSWTIYLDRISWGPLDQGATKGVVVTDPEEYTPSFQGFGTVTNVNAQWMRVGAMIRVWGRATAGTVAASEAQIGLPSGLTIDLPGSPIVVGDYVHAGQASASDLGFATLATDGDTFINISRNNSSSGNELLPRDGDEVAVNSSSFSWFAEVPIAGWSSNAKQSVDFGNREVSFYAIRETSAQTISVTTEQTLIFNGEVSDKTNSYDTSSGIFTAPQTGSYIFHAGFRLGNLTSGEAYSFRLKQGSTVRTFMVDAQSLTERFMTMTSPVLSLVKGDTVSITVDSASDSSYTLDNTGVNSYFSGYKIQRPETLVGTEPVIVSYSTNDASTNNFANGSEATVVFEDFVIDTHNAMNAGVFTAPVTGKYRVSSAIATAAVNWDSGESIYLNVDKNNSTYRRLERQESDSTEANDIPLYIGGSTIVPLEQGDTLRIRFYQDTGSSLAISNNGQHNYVDIELLTN